MSRKKIIILTLSLVAIVIIDVISFKLYPIVFVGWQPVIYGNFSKNYDSAVFYYAKAISTYNKSNADIINSLEVRNEIKRAGLEASIEDILISNELKKIFSNSELKNQTDKNVNAAIQGKDIKKETEALYGLSSGEFTKYFLEPQARREILEARLRLENGDFKQWLAGAEKRAKVMIFLPGFEWKGGTVIIKK
ncbi:MAG: hypothetical protein D4Q79_02350 [Spirochaetia bacterium]|nr:MAG: hypothetical protein D4Q79_02350 [Spirochaetia bacterium]